MLLRRQTNLTALSKEFLVTYELKQKEFYEHVAQCPADFETVCQLRDTILNTCHPESYEGPELLDPSMHFTPIKRLIIKKLNRNSPQLRRRMLRHTQRSTDNRYQSLKDDISDSDSSSSMKRSNQQVLSLLLSSGASNRNPR